MRRRDAIILLVFGAILRPVGASAQQPGSAAASSEARPRLIGVLSGIAEDDPLWRTGFAGFVATLRDRGWVEGQNYRFEKRFVPGGGGTNIFDAAATDLLAKRPDVIFVFPGITAGVALLRKTRTIPIVFMVSFDPVLEGLVTSLAHPGGNVTGFNSVEPSMASKLPQLLKEIAPDVTRAVLFFGAGWKSTEALSRLAAEYADFVEQGARSSGVTMSRVFVSTVEEIESALATFAQQPNGGLIQLPDSFISAHRAQVTALAARFRLPAVYSWRAYALDGGLLSYGIDLTKMYRQAAGYVDRVLRGERPADLPVQAPTKFELVINLKTAKALGLTIPPSLLIRADEVIE